MALILDKTKVTNYVDECGNVQENPYLVIDSVVINKFNDGYVHKFSTNILTFLFKDASARVDNRKPLEEKRYFVEDPSLYDQYFSISSMANFNIFHQSYEYINLIYPNWKSDEV